MCAQFLPAIKGAIVLSDTPIPEGKNPLKENPITGNWPDQLSRYEKRALAIRESAKLVSDVQPFSDQQISELSKENEIISDLGSIINELKNKSDVTKVLLPARLSVSTLLYLKQEPEQLALRLRRPMPNHIDKFARRGTDFHLWLEDHFKHTSLISLDEVFNNGVGTQIEDAPMQELQKAWLASDWANQIPVGVEVGFETVIAGTVIRGRIDAVYEKTPGKFEVVDWKTGKVKSGEDLSVAAVQLAMYRLAFAKLNKLDLANVSAAFHYVAQNETVRPADIMSETQLIEIISQIPVAQ